MPEIDIPRNLKLAASVGLPMLLSACGFIPSASDYRVGADFNVLEISGKMDSAEKYAATGGKEGSSFGANFNAPRAGQGRFRIMERLNCTTADLDFRNPVTYDIDTAGLIPDMKVILTVAAPNGVGGVARGVLYAGDIAHLHLEGSEDVWTLPITVDGVGYEPKQVPLFAGEDLTFNLFELKSDNDNKDVETVDGQISGIRGLSQSALGIVSCSNSH